VNQLYEANNLILELSKRQSKDEKRDYLISKKYDDTSVTAILDDKHGISCSSTTAKLSIKALNEFIPKLFQTSSGEILTSFINSSNIIQSYDYSNKSLKVAFKQIVAPQILSPSVKRSC
jgi:hypothetical protein